MMMRWLALVAALLAAAGARADISLPGASGGDGGARDCGPIFDGARREAAALDARFARAELQSDGPGRWDLTLWGHGGLYATVAVFPLGLDVREDWFAAGDEHPAYVRWIDRREGFVLLTGFPPETERRVRALFQSAADRCLGR